MEPTPRLVKTTELTIMMDHSQFYIHGGGADSVFALVEQALADGNWASNGRSIVVITPVEYNFDMPVRAELWTGPPASDLGDWTVHYTTELQISSGMLQLESTGGVPIGIPVPNGAYRLDIAGRDFPSSRSVEPNERWRIRLWPFGFEGVPEDHGLSSVGTAERTHETSGTEQSFVSPLPQLHFRNTAPIDRSAQQAH